VSCGCTKRSPCHSAGCSAAELRRVAAFANCDVDRAIRRASVLIDPLGVNPPSATGVKGFPTPITGALANWERHPVSPPEGRGWIELSSPDAFVIWAVVTSQNGTERVEYRRTGPASKDGAYIQNGAQVLFWPVNTCGPFHVDAQNGARGFGVGSFVGGAAVAEFFAGLSATDFLRPETYWIDIGGERGPVQNGPGVVIGYPVGYNRFLSATFGRPVTLQVLNNDIWKGWVVGATVYDVNNERHAIPVSPWTYVQFLSGGGPVEAGQIMWSVFPTGVGNG
jgi:hypothetical protein